MCKTKLLHRIIPREIIKLTKVSGEKGILVNQQISWRTGNGCIFCSQKRSGTQTAPHINFAIDWRVKKVNPRFIFLLSISFVSICSDLANQCMSEEENQCQNSESWAYLLSRETWWIFWCIHYQMGQGRSFIFLYATVVKCHAFSVIRQRASRDND